MICDTFIFLLTCLSLRRKHSHLLSPAFLVAFDTNSYYSTTLNFGVLPLVEIDHVTR